MRFCGSRWLASALLLATFVVVATAQRPGQPGAQPGTPRHLKRRVVAVQTEPTVTARGRECSRAHTPQSPEPYPSSTTTRKPRSLAFC